MTDDKNMTARDRKRISLQEDYEVAYWTKALGVTEQELRAAVAKVGSSADAVRQSLR